MSLLTFVFAEHLGHSHILLATFEKVTIKLFFFVLIILQKYSAIKTGAEIINPFDYILFSV